MRIAWPPTAPRLPMRSGARSRRSRKRASRGRPANPSWPVRASNTSGAHGWCARASTSWPAWKRGCNRSKSWRRPGPGYGDAARTLLAQANGKVEQKGAVADYLEVDDRIRAGRRGLPGRPAAARHRRASRARGRRFWPGARSGRGPLRVPDRRTGRCGVRALTSRRIHRTIHRPDGVVALSSVVRVNGAYAGAIRDAIGDAWIADSYERAAGASHLTPLAVVTPEGDVFRGPHLVTGGLHEEATRHSRNQGRDQGACAAASRPSATRSLRLAEETSVARCGHRAGDQRDCRPGSRAPQAGEGRRRPGGAAAARRGRGDASRLRRASSSRANGGRPKRSAKPSTAARAKRASRLRGWRTTSGRPTIG